MPETSFVMRLKEILAYALAFWWVRTFTVLVACFLQFILVNYAVELLRSYRQLDISTETTIVYCALYSSPVIFSIVVEYARCFGTISTLGFTLSRFTLWEIFWGFLMAGTGISLIALSMFAMGVPFQHILNWKAESIVFTVLLATCEEFIFRGMLLKGIEKKYGSIVALLSSSVLFAFAHFFNSNFTSMAGINIALAGVVFGAMYLLTRSLWMSIAFHAGWNFIEYSLFGRSPDPALFASISPNLRWLLTGEYGIEQGVCTTIILVVILIVLPKITKVSPYTASALFKQRYAEAKLKASFKN